MIDNPTPQQRMEEMDQQYMAEQFHEHCTDRANEIAKEFDLLPEFYDAKEITKEISSLAHWIENGEYPKKEDFKK